MTEFYCCDELEEFVALEEFTIQEYREIIGIKYCPFCAYRLDAL